MSGHNYLPFVKQSSVLVTKLLGSRIPRLLRTTVHMWVQVHLQVALPPCDSHGQMDRQQVVNYFLSLQFY